MESKVIEKKKPTKKPRDVFCVGRATLYSNNVTIEAVPSVLRSDEG